MEAEKWGLYTWMITKAISTQVANIPPYKVKFTATKARNNMYVLRRAGDGRQLHRASTL